MWLVAILRSDVIPSLLCQGRDCDETSRWIGAKQIACRWVLESSGSYQLKPKRYNRLGFDWTGKFCSERYFLITDTEHSTCVDCMWQHMGIAGLRGCRSVTANGLTPSSICSKRTITSRLHLSNSAGAAAWVSPPLPLNFAKRQTVARSITSKASWSATLALCWQTQTQGAGHRARDRLQWYKHKNI